MTQPALKISLSATLARMRQGDVVTIPGDAYAEMTVRALASKYGRDTGALLKVSARTGDYIITHKGAR